MNPDGYRFFMTKNFRVYKRSRFLKNTVILFFGLFKGLDMPPVLQREHPVLQNMKIFLIFLFSFVDHFCFPVSHPIIRTPHSVGTPPMYGSA